MSEGVPRPPDEAERATGRSEERVHRRTSEDSDSERVADPNTLAKPGEGAKSPLAHHFFWAGQAYS